MATQVPKAKIDQAITLAQRRAYVQLPLEERRGPF